jgi:ribosomal protein S5
MNDMTTKCVNCGAEIVYQTSAYHAWRGKYGASTVCIAAAVSGEGHRASTEATREILAAEKARHAWQARN